MASQVVQSIWKRLSGSSFTTLGSPTDTEDKEQASNMERSDRRKNVRFEGEDKMAEPGEHQIHRPGMPKPLPKIPGPDELPAAWVKQQKDLEIVRAEKTQLEEEVISLEFHKEALRNQVSDERRAKNFLEPRFIKLEKELGECYKQNEALNVANEGLKRKVHEYADGIGSGMDEQEELKNINSRLLEQVKSTEQAVQAKEKNIIKLKADLILSFEWEVKCQVLESEVSTLNDDLLKSQKEIEVMAKQIEAMEKQEAEQEAEREAEQGLDLNTEATKPFGEELYGPIYSSLSDELSGSEYGDDSNSGEKHDTMVEAVEGASPTTPRKVKQRYSIPIRRGTNAGTQTQSKSEMGVFSMSTQTQAEDRLTSKGFEKQGKFEYITISTQTPATASIDEESSPLERYLARQLPGAMTERTYLSPSTKYVPSPLLEFPSTPLPGSTILQSEPSPLSLNGRSNSFSGETRTGQLGSLSSIPESEMAGHGLLETVSTGSPPLRFAGKAPEIAMARLAKPLGSPESVAGSAMSGSTIINSDSSSPIQFIKLFDQRNRDRQPSWPYHPRPSPSLRDGVSTNMAEVLSQRTSKGVQTDGNARSQPTKRDGCTKLGKLKTSESSERIYSSLIWWFTLGGLVLLWYFFGQDDKQLWMEANERTRRMVVTLRDERWFGPVWLTKLGFLMENLVKVDRSLLG